VLRADEAGRGEQDHHSDDRAEQSGQIEDLRVANPEQIREDQPTDDRAGQAERDGNAMVVKKPVLSLPGITSRPTKPAIDAQDDPRRSCDLVSSVRDAVFVDCGPAGAFARPRRALGCAQSC
jgi:hypothetical protein